MPNTKVRPSSALVGALVAGALWQTGGWVFATFMVGSTKYDAIYSSLAILILFMIWVYLAWLILLIGASIAFYLQHPELLTMPTRELHLSNRVRERLALVVAGRIAARQYSDAPPWTSQALASTLRIPGVHDRPDPAVKIVEQKVQAAINSALSGYTLKDLVQHTADERHAETGHDTERAASG